jgi:CDP-glucose 4,6-dehydratase
VRWLLDRLAGQMPGTRWHCPGGEQLHEASFLKLDSSKARARLQWEPRWALNEALRRTVDWHLAWTAGRDMRAFCLAQIAEHQADTAF